MISIMNLSIFILHNVVSSFAQRFNYRPNEHKVDIFYCVSFQKKNNECLKNMSTSH